MTFKYIHELTLKEVYAYDLFEYHVFKAILIFLEVICENDIKNIKRLRSLSCQLATLIRHLHDGFYQHLCKKKWFELRKLFRKLYYATVKDMCEGNRDKDYKMVFYILKTLSKKYYRFILQEQCPHFDNSLKWRVNTVYHTIKRL